MSWGTVLLLHRKPDPLSVHRTLYPPLVQRRTVDVRDARRGIGPATPASAKAPIILSSIRLLPLHRPSSSEAMLYWESFASGVTSISEGLVLCSPCRCIRFFEQALPEQSQGGSIYSLKRNSNSSAICSNE